MEIDPMTRVLLAFALLMLLGSCNLVTSQRPLFGLKDAAPAYLAEPGIWVVDDAACIFDLTRPVRTWPNCAQHLSVPSRGRLVFGPNKDGSRLLVAASEPLIIQLDQKDPSGGALYLAARVMERSERGRATALQYWLVQCGPAPPLSERQGSYVSATPWPGLKMHENGCVVHDVPTLLAVAAASEAWGEKPTFFRWVRRR